MTQFGSCNFSNAEVEKLYITKWTSDVIVDIDSNHNVTAISGTTEGWNKIETDTATVLFNQVLNEPNANGINHTETISILVPHADSGKWLNLVDLLSERYIIVFQDGNLNWFVMGWRFGTKVESYTLGENQYSINFINSFSTSLLSAIDESYVTTNII